MNSTILIPAVKWDNCHLNLVYFAHSSELKLSRSALELVSRRSQVRLRVGAVFGFFEHSDFLHNWLPRRFELYNMWQLCFMRPRSPFHALTKLSKI